MQTEHKAEALNLTKEIAELMDRRLFRQRQFLWAVRSRVGEAVELAKEEYRAALFEWNDSFGRIRAGLWNSFGRETALSFENMLHSRFQRIGVRIEAAFLGEIKSSLTEEERQLNILGRDTYEFVHGLLKTIDRNDFYIYRKQFEVSHENWGNLSNFFLLQRLFGLFAES
jgi:hypothetical protein